MNKPKSIYLRNIKQQKYFQTRGRRAYLILGALALLVAIILSGCAGGAGSQASSWPGVSVNEDTAYVAYNQHVYAVDLNSGIEKWRYPKEADNSITFYAPPALTPDGQLIVGGYNNILYSLDPESGQEKWTFSDATSRYIGSALVSERGIFSPNADSQLYALDLNGQPSWKFTTQEANWAQPTADEDCTCIYLSSMDHQLYSIDSENGSQIWKTEPLGGSIVGSPALSSDGVLYTGTFINEILAIDASNGNVIWRFPTDNWVWGGPQVYDGIVYAGDLSGNLYAIDATNGTAIWKIQPDSAITESPLITEDAIYISTESGTLYSVNHNGATRWSKELGKSLQSSPVQAGEKILVAPTGGDELLIALDVNGNQVWTFTPEQK
jgi:outer membrane protein assembly factor BamB